MPLLRHILSRQTITATLPPRLTPLVPTALCHEQADKTSDVESRAPHRRGKEMKRGPGRSERLTGAGCREAGRRRRRASFAGAAMRTTQQDKEAEEGEEERHRRDSDASLRGGESWLAGRPVRGRPNPLAAGTGRDARMGGTDSSPSVPGGTDETEPVA